MDSPSQWTSLRRHHEPLAIGPGRGRTWAFSNIYLIFTGGERRFVGAGDHGRCSRVAANEGVFPEDGAFAEHERLHFGVGLDLLHGPPFHNVKAVARFPGFVNGFARPEGSDSQRMRQLVELVAR